MFLKYSSILFYFILCHLISLLVDGPSHMIYVIHKRVSKFSLIIIIIIITTVTLFREITIHTERPTLLGEVSTNFCG
jgi:hypothetical protein